MSASNPFLALRSHVYISIEAPACNNDIDLTGSTATTTLLPITLLTYRTQSKWVEEARFHTRNTSGRQPVVGTVNLTTGKQILLSAAS